MPDLTLDLADAILTAPASAHTDLLQRTVQLWLERCHSTARIQRLDVVDDDARVQDVLGNACAVLQHAVAEDSAVGRMDLQGLDWDGRWSWILESEDPDDDQEPDLLDMFDDGSFDTLPVETSNDPFQDAPGLEVRDGQ